MIAGVIVLALFAAQSWLLLHLLEQHGRLLIRLDDMEARGGVGGVAPAAPAVPTMGLPVGTPAPTFALAGLYGETLTLDALRASGKPALLLFTDPNYGTPSAVLVDAKGMIASGVAVGKDAVLALAGVNQDQAQRISF